MSGLFTGKDREEREAEKQQKQAEIADQYDGMVTKALERLTRWAFPDSQVERQGVGAWQLWHTTDGGEKYVDVTVELQFAKGRPKSFFCDGSVSMHIAELTRENLDDALRQSICSLDNSG
jgi:hypothetical protein